MQCNAMQCNAMQCNAMQCNAMQCNAMQCNAMQCNAMQYNTIQYNPEGSLGRDERCFLEHERWLVTRHDVVLWRTTDDQCYKRRMVCGWTRVFGGSFWHDTLAQYIDGVVSIL